MEDLTIDVKGIADDVGEKVARSAEEKLTVITARHQRLWAESREGREAEDRIRASRIEENAKLKAENAELDKQKRDEQAALDAIKAEYASLLPKVEELRAERATHIERVKRALEAS